MTQRILDHASICVANVERSRQFYEGLLGLSPAPRPDFGFPGMWYQIGEGQLHLIQRDRQPVAAAHAIDATDPHLAIRVDDLEGMRRRLQAAGLKVLDFGSEQL